MEKLIELLNEYEKLDNLIGNRRFEKGKIHNKYYYGSDCELLIMLVIISKQYGFIKWLVENEKIDLENIPPIAITKGGEETAYNEPVMIIDRVLMLLSIQDEPIEFLVSILK